MNWIQNDNQNVDGVRSTPQSLTVIITSSLFGIIFIMLHSFDAVLCQMIVLDYIWKHLLFWFLLVILSELFFTCVILSIFLRST